MTAAITQTSARTEPSVSKPRASTKPARVAVLLNANAKRVSDQLQGAIATMVPAEDIFLSHSGADAQAIARTVLARGYETVFTGGGDGTFVGFVNELCACAGAQPLPRFGILRLGTGNALASLVGAATGRDGPLDDLSRARAGGVCGTFDLDLVEAEGVRCPFAGLGVDAHVINAYSRVKAALRPTLGRWAEGGLGYAIAVAAKTIPYYLATPMPEIEIRNTGSTAFFLDSQGRPFGAAIEHGEPLYRGPAKIVAGGTVPNFGFDFRFFPFAGRRRQRMHLRVFSGSTLGVLTHLPQTFDGTYFPKGIADFFCDSVEIRSTRPMPFQIGGDPAGLRDRLTLQMADRPVKLLDFRATAAA